MSDDSTPEFPGIPSNEALDEFPGEILQLIAEAAMYVLMRYVQKDRIDDARKVAADITRMEAYFRARRERCVCPKCVEAKKALGDKATLAELAALERLDGDALPEDGPLHAAAAEFLSKFTGSGGALH